MKNSIEKIRVKEIIGPNEIIIYATKWYKKNKFYENDFHKVEELEKYENIKLYVEK